MATALGRTTSFMRKFTVFAIIGTVTLTILQIFTGILTIPEGNNNPPGGTVPPTSYISNCTANNLVFGSKIPVLAIPSKTLATGTKALFKTDIIEKEFPLFPSTLQVYSIRAPIERITDTDRAKRNAVNLGFSPNLYSTDPQNNGIIFWKNNDESRTFTYDKANRKWELSVNYNKAPLKNLSQDLQLYTNTLSNFNSKFELNNTLFTNATASYELILNKFDGSQELVSDATVANILRVSLYKKFDYATCRPNNSGVDTTYSTDVYPTDYLFPSFRIDLTGTAASFKEDVAKIYIQEYAIDEELIGVYPALTLTEAIKKLENNQGLLYWIQPQDRNKYGFIPELSIQEFLINVNSTKIVYIEPERYIEDDLATHFIEPYYFIQGVATQNNGKFAEFIFLVPALQDTYYL